VLFIIGCGKQMTVTRAKLIEGAGPATSVSPASERSFSDGLSLYRADKLDAAAGYFRQAVKADPTNWQAHYFLGLVYRKQFDRTAAVAALHAALTHAPKERRERALIYLALGELWEQQGDLSRAELSYRTALNLHPGSSRAQSGLRRLEQLSQRIEK
jgi:Tfp pilus assembly protein PilF